MTKKTSEQIQILIRNELQEIKRFCRDDLSRTNYCLRQLEERIKIAQVNDIMLTISNILAKCDFCHNNTDRYKCLKNMPCSTCIYNFLNKRLTDIYNEKKGSGDT